MAQVEDADLQASILRLKEMAHGMDGLPTAVRHISDPSSASTA